MTYITRALDWLLRWNPCGPTAIVVEEERRCAEQLRWIERIPMTAAEFDAWMTEHGWSNRRLADELEVAVSSIARWRVGTRPIARTVALALKTLERRQGRSGRAA